MTETENIDVILGKRLRFLREQKNHTQKELAEKIGVVFQQIQKYETGVNRMSCCRLFQIMEALDISIYEFFSGIRFNNRFLISEEEGHLLGAFRNTDEKFQKAIITLLAAEK